MTRIFATILEPRLEQAIDAIGQIDDDRLGIEVRVDSFDPAGERRFDLGAIRNTSRLPMIYTRRSGPNRPPAFTAEIRDAIEAGFDLVDVEMESANPLAELPLERVLLSHHDYESLPDLDRLIDRMARTGVRNLKIAVTPGSFDQDRSLLTRLHAWDDRCALTLFGMGPFGLYSRTLAPFLGSRLSFVAIDEARSAAPGQLTLERGLQIWGGLVTPGIAPAPTDPSELRTAPALFAVVGNPVRHSQSPRIHNARFRQANVRAAYGMIELDSIGPLLDAMEDGAPLSPRGLSVTAPFKTDLLVEAQRRGWNLTERAELAGSANTVVRTAGGFLVDNTDVLGFVRALEGIGPDARIAVVGAGGTARAAAVAAEGRSLTFFNRTRSRAEALATELGGEAKTFEEMEDDSWDVVIDTLPGDVSDRTKMPGIREDGLLIRTGYDRQGHCAPDGSSSSRGSSGLRTFSPLDLLEAQAEEQSRLFIATAGGEK